MTDINTPEARLLALGLTLPTPSTPIGTYSPYRRAGDVLFLSGVSPRLADNSVVRGRVGESISVESAYSAARLCGMTLLANIQAALGSLDAVEAVLKVTGFVAATLEFEQHPKIIDGCADLFVEVFGEAGRSARSAVGVAGLPRGIPVEVEAIVLVRPGLDTRAVGAAL
jgi:enamine deaminase RidA (YjgF/YER057c/UK114 family)